MYNWKQEGNKVFLEFKDIEINFEMPSGWKLKDTHPTLLRLVEFILFSPYERKGFKMNDILKWKRRKFGNKSALSFSTGADSTATMLLMPKDTLLYYHKRNEYLGGKMNQDNALNMIDKIKRKVYVIGSNHERVRMAYGKKAGFSTDFACMVGLILLADYLDLGIVSTGTMLGSTYVEKGNKYRDFENSEYWIRWNILFHTAGLKISFPVGGCSEVITSKIVNESNLKHLSHSCIRGSNGMDCDNCSKCFRKNLLNGKLSNISNEVKNMLEKRPIHQGDSLIYASNKNKIELKELKEYKNSNLDWLERYYTDALILVPELLRDGIKQKLDKLGIKPMTKEDIKQMKEFKI